MYKVEGQETVDYIIEHKKRVQKRLLAVANELIDRAKHHDDSKLEDPELSGWVEMDKEARYKYGTPEYQRKLNKWKWLLRLHWKNNRHHPEYFDNLVLGKETERDLLDLIEMVADWISYKDDLRYSEASELVKKQCERYGFSEEISDLLLNTLKNYYVEF